MFTVLTGRGGKPVVLPGFGLLLALLVGAALGAPGVVAQGTAGAEETTPVEGLLKVVSPRENALVRGNKVRVKLELAEGASLESATLNGVRVKRFFKTRSSGRVVGTLRKRKLRKVLPRGRNFVRVTGARGEERDYDALSLTRVKKSRSLVRRFKVEHSSKKAAQVTVVPTKPYTKVRVKVNNQNVSRLFKRTTPLKRKVLLGASDGLRHGRNRIRVLASHHDGQIRRLRASFRIPRRVTIAGAGPDRRARAGEAVRLNGKASKKARGGSGRPKGGRLRYQWRIVRSPKRSTAKLEGRNRRKPTLRTDVPGHYRLKLRTTQAPRGQASVAATGGGFTDTADTTVLPQPFVQYEAFASAGGQSGITVQQTRDCEGNEVQGPYCFYPNEGDGDDLQVVTLDRVTLTPVNIPKPSGSGSFASNTFYETDELAGLASQMEALVANPGSKCPTFDTIPNPNVPSAGDDYMVLMALRSGSISDTDNWNAATQWFNMEPPAPTSNSTCATPQSQPVPTEEFSEIAVPGMLEGKAWINEGLTLDSDPTQQAGNLLGYLSPTAPPTDPTAAASSYSFSYQDAFTFNTRDTSGGQPEFTVGDDSVPVVPSGQPADSDGLAVFSFDPINPEGTIEQEAFVTNSNGTGTGLAWGVLQDTLIELQGVPGTIGVGITSNGQIGQFGTEPQAESFLDVLQLLDQLGANPDTFARAVNANGTYSMLAVDGIADESSSAFTGGLPEDADPPPSDYPVNDGTLTGILERGANGDLFPLFGDPSGSDLELEFIQTVKQDQTPWLLTPAPNAQNATCQEVAFGYIVAVQFPSVYPDGASSLWGESSSPSACDVDHSGTQGPKSPDNLDDDMCAADDPNGIGADAGNVYEASIGLRDTEYTSSNFSPPDIMGVPMPSDANAPFTEDDLTCAKNQMTDEFNAVSQSNVTMTDIGSIMSSSQGASGAALAAVAENVQQAALMPLDQQMQEQGQQSTGAFWASMGFYIFEGVADVGAFAAGPEASAGLTALSLVGESGGNFFAAVEGPGGNPVELTNDYLLLQSELGQTQVFVDEQIEAVITAQGHGVEITNEVINSDPGKLATMQTESEGDGPWNLGVDEIDAAEDAFVYRTSQLAYQDFWPQVFTAVRVNWDHACLPSAFGTGQFCYQGGKWSAVGSASGDPITATETVSLSGCASNMFNRPFDGASPGTPFGFGQGNEYHPMLGVATADQDAATGGPYEAYVTALASDINSDSLAKHTPQLADAEVMGEIFAQPASSDDNQNAGFYAPDFWQQNTSLTDRVTCGTQQQEGQPQSAEMTLSIPGGIYDQITAPTDEWPTEGGAPPGTGSAASAGTEASEPADGPER